MSYFNLILPILNFPFKLMCETVYHASGSLDPNTPPEFLKAPEKLQ